MTILTELRDPRISDVTVTLVEVSADMRYAKIHVSVMGDEAKQKECVKALRNASGFLQQKIGKRIDTRYTPRLRFELDQGVKRSIEVARILDEVLPRDRDDLADNNDVAAESENEHGTADGCGHASDAQADNTQTDHVPADDRPANEER